MRFFRLFLVFFLASFCLLLYFGDFNLYLYSPTGERELKGYPTPVERVLGSIGLNSSQQMQ